LITSSDAFKNHHKQKRCIKIAKLNQKTTNTQKSKIKLRLNNKSTHSVTEQKERLSYARHYTEATKVILLIRNETKSTLSVIFIFTRHKNKKQPHIHQKHRKSR